MSILSILFLVVVYIGLATAAVDKKPRWFYVAAIGLLLAMLATPDLYISVLRGYGY